MNDVIVLQILKAKDDAGDEKFYMKEIVLDCISLKTRLPMWYLRSPPYIRSRTR